eukprot:CAMPEP_0202974244 /NCGR_PEP_ID=MMETSP1396-20130829/58768_1 /ASSEMBLY_ACC=CAM_ASM_000872 /TAXON_ID= /ORGANISM="Pseudokeronopsis sp., Strain Brazil" /LENGTH=47 /DNA_ID= /DNA_START= /DNA_END= /DNA_ORIENTATION=
MTLGERDAPLKQEGIENVQAYNQNLRKQMTQGKVPLEVIDLISEMQN